MNKSGQVSLETAFATIITILLLLGAAYLFVWLNKCMVKRQQAYINSTNTTNDAFYDPEPLKIDILTPAPGS